MAQDPRLSWSTPIDAYCERTDASFWSEPFNALTNLSFIAAAAIAYLAWRRSSRDGAILVLIVLTATIGVGSFLFHTFATRWAVLADVVPINLFILAYFFLAMRRFFGLGITASIAVSLGFQALSLVVPAVWSTLVVRGGQDPLNGSIAYAPAAAALFVIAGLLAAKGSAIAGNLVEAGAIFLVSLVFRTVDELACNITPVGTHAVWHVLNGVVLLILISAAMRHSAKTGTSAKDQPAIGCTHPNCRKVDRF